MSDEKRYDQAEPLRRLVEKREEEKQDISTFPPRSEVHKHKKKKVKWKIKFPLVRLLLILFFVIIFFLFTMPIWIEKFS